MTEFTPHTPIDDKNEDPEELEDFLEHEAPNNDRRDRYSKEYAGLANNSIEASADETDIVPDGHETFPESDDFLRARGGNYEGSVVVQGDQDEEEMIETPDSEGYASDWKGQHPAPEDIEDEESRQDDSQRQSIPPTNPNLPSGR